MQLVDTFEQAEQNAVRFSEILGDKGTTVFKRLGTFFHWYYFPKCDSFAPSKFIGYQETMLANYEGGGTGRDTTDVLNRWFHKLDKDTPMYRSLEAKLSDFLASAGKTLSQKTREGTGGIYVPVGTWAVTPFPDQVTDEDYHEGAVKIVTVNAYERNPRARAACIKHYWCVCQVCGIDVAKIYGAVGSGFIHVHHLDDVSLKRKEYIVDPIRDLRPLCPNCHAMVHMEKPAMRPEKLAILMKEQRETTNRGRS